MAETPRRSPIARTLILGMAALTASGCQAPSREPARARGPGRVSGALRGSGAATPLAGAASGVRGSEAAVPVDGAADPGTTAAFTDVFDLDRDGAPESTLSLERCGSDRKGYCLRVSGSPHAAAKLIPLTADGRKRDRNRMAGFDLRAIGNHAGTRLSEVAVLYLEGRASPSRPSLAIVDVDAGRVLARTSAPAGQVYTFTAYPRDPAGTAYPVLAPSFGDAPGIDPVLSSAPGTWGYLCLYSRGGSGQGQCAPGFTQVSTVPAGERDWFREGGGYVQDTDGDGWEEIHLIYHSLILPISARAAAPGPIARYDIAAASEPRSPRNFHSGRQYGTHRPMSLPGGPATLMVGGAPVGAFDDVACSVSRFIGLLQGAPGARRLVYSHYYGYGGNTYSRFNRALSFSPERALSRPGDVMNGCIHRFHDSLASMDGRSVVVYDVFQQSAPVDRCVSEQYSLYLEPAWTPEKHRVYTECFARNLKSRGTWAMRMHDLETGRVIAGSAGSYVWGWSGSLIPGGDSAYLVEDVGGEGAFDLSDRTAAPTLRIRTLSGGRWGRAWRLPVAARPKLGHQRDSALVGLAKGGELIRLTLRDVDGDGLLDVQLANGSWVGYARATDAFVVK